MKVVNNRIIVQVNMEQKNSMIVGGVLLHTALKFEVNYREKSPVIAKVVEGNKYLNKGDILICHHNHFYPPSPYFLEDDLYSIPFNKTIFAKINSEGKITPICGNILGERIPIKTEFEVPSESRKKYIDRILVTHKGWSKHKQGQIILCKPNAPYDIVYNFGGIEKRITKVSEDMVLGYLQ